MEKLNCSGPCVPSPPRTALAGPSRYHSSPGSPPVSLWSRWWVLHRRSDSILLLGPNPSAMCFKGDSVFRASLIETFESASVMATNRPILRGMGRVTTRSVLWSPRSHCCCIVLTVVFRGQSLKVFIYFDLPCFSLIFCGQRSWSPSSANCLIARVFLYIYRGASYWRERAKH